MRKTLTYPSFVIASLLVILIFVTAKTYTQLGIAVLLYLPLAFFALKVFPRKAWRKGLSIEFPAIKPAQKTEVQKVEVKKERVEIADIDKRAFLKLIGAAGLSFFIFSLINRRADALFFGRAGGSGTTTTQDSTGKIIDPAERQPTDGYKISEVDDNVITYYGFINKDGAWFIMREDTDTRSFRYAKGDSRFPTNWSKREQLKYDYFHNTF